MVPVICSTLDAGRRFGKFRLLLPFTGDIMFVYLLLYLPAKCYILTQRLPDRPIAAARVVYMVQSVKEKKL
jgi:hypothetical protein